jgi:UDP:flavonoid glycosyltransferase YjiC (YdhE family)
MSRHYLFVTWDGAGSVPPELSVARELIARGHRVSVLADPTIRAEAEAVGADFRPWREAPHIVSRRPEDVLMRDYDVGSPSKLIALMCDKLIATPAGVQAGETTAAIRELRPDAIVASGLLVGPQIAGEAQGLPVFGLMGNIYPMPARGLPPFGTGWRPGRGPLGRARDAAMARIGRGWWDRGLPAVNQARTDLGLAPLATLWEQLDHAERILVLTSAHFDFAGELPANVRYVGPRLDDPEWVEPWQAPPGDDPLVLVSLSSGPQDQLALLRKVVDALARMPVRGVVTTGNSIDPADVPAPPHVQVLRSAPHALVLEEAAAVISHGGHGTVVKALAAGLPQLILPMGRDQRDNATRVTVRGAGSQVKPSAKPAAIAAALRGVLDDPAYRSAAERLGALLRADSKSGEAIRELERLEDETPAPSAEVRRPALGSQPSRS